MQFTFAFPPVFLFTRKRLVRLHVERREGKQTAVAMTHDIPRAVLACFVPDGSHLEWRRHSLPDKTECQGFFLRA